MNRLTMSKKYEVVEYRNCDCGDEFCPGERETIHFEHEKIEECRDFMLRLADSISFPTEIFQSKTSKDKIELKVYLLSGLVATRKFRVQEIDNE